MLFVSEGINERARDATVESNDRDGEFAAKRRKVDLVRVGSKVL
jgi:hypothetical protein